MGFAYHYFTIKPGLFEVRVFVFYKRIPAEWPDFIRRKDCRTNHLVRQPLLSVTASPVYLLVATSIKIQSVLTSLISLSLPRLPDQSQDPALPDLLPCINALQLHQLTCSCGHSSCLTMHGYYKRHIRAEHSSSILRILRLRCSECGAAHAILLSSIVPYSQISFSVQVNIAEKYDSHLDTISVCELNPDIDENNIKSMIRSYRRRWREKLCSESVCFTPAILLVWKCFAFFPMQFMQIRGTINLLFAAPT